MNLSNPYIPSTFFFLTVRMGAVGEIPWNLNWLFSQILCMIYTPNLVCKLEMSFPYRPEKNVCLVCPFLANPKYLKLGSLPFFILNKNVGKKIVKIHLTVPDMYCKQVSWNTNSPNDSGTNPFWGSVGRRRYTGTQFSGNTPLDNPAYFLHFLSEDVGNIFVTHAAKTCLFLVFSIVKTSFTRWFSK